MVLKRMLRGLGNGRAGWKAVTGYCGEKCFGCNLAELGLISAWTFLTTRGFEEELHPGVSYDCFAGVIEQYKLPRSNGIQVKVR